MHEFFRHLGKFFLGKSCNNYQVFGRVPSEFHVSYFNLLLQLA